MSLWRVVLLMNLAIAVSLGVGYGVWGRRVATLETSVKATQAQVDDLARERDALRAGGRPGERRWEGRGIVRAVYPGLIIVTHEEIPGLLPARTTRFRLADSVDRSHARAGDSIRFWLQGVGDASVLVGLEAW